MPTNQRYHFFHFASTYVKKSYQRDKKLIINLPKNGNFQKKINNNMEKKVMNSAIIIFLKIISVKIHELKKVSELYERND